MIDVIADFVFKMFWVMGKLEGRYEDKTDGHLIIVRQPRLW